MIDLGARLVVVAVIAVVVAAVVARAYRSSGTRPASSIDGRSLGLSGGFVFFSSASCATCLDARVVLDRVCGPDGYEERAWETDADGFTRAGVDEVPLTVVVDRHGRVRVVLRGVPRPWRLRAELVRHRLRRS